MNMVDYKIIKVLTLPKKREYSSFWTVDCIIDDEGGEREKTLYFNTFDEAANLRPGQIGQH